MSYIDEYNNFVDEVKTLIENKKFTKAAGLLKSGLSKNPNDKHWQRFYYSVLIKLKEYKEAKFWLLKFIAKCKSQVDSLYYRGLYYYIEGDITRSIESLKQCFFEDIYYLKKIFYDISFEELRESKEFKSLIYPYKEYKIDNYISLKLLFSKTIIYICDYLFLTCQKVALSLVPSEFDKFEDFKDIDDIIKYYKSKKTLQSEVLISPEEEFWAHCSNLQTWAESGYNTSLLSKNLSFPILVELSKRGISKFAIILKEELIYRIKAGGIKTLLYFIADTEVNYLEYLGEDDLFDGLLSLEEADIMKDITQFIPLEYTLTTSLLDSRRFPSVRSEKKMHFCIEDGHIAELELLLNDYVSSTDYLEAISKISNLKQLKVLSVYITEDIMSDSPLKVYWKSLTNFDNLMRDLDIKV
jgi:tetratricopeptide (TPR) repeat protein